MVSFRGTEATNLLNWQTNITINMTCRDGLGGTRRPGPSRAPTETTVVRAAACVDVCG